MSYKFLAFSIMNSLRVTPFTITARIVQKPSDNQLYGYLPAPNIKYAHVSCCKASASSERERWGLSYSVLKPKENKQETKLVDGNRSTNTGIGILEFLPGKSYFITGGTGFLGKAVIEKILRTSPEVGKIYVLIKAPNDEAAFKRLKTEIVDSDLFKCLRLQHGKSYETFMLSKLVSICGNVSESNLGMNPNSVGAIAREIDVIINSAANTTFDERFDVSVNANTRGPSRVLNFAKKCKKLCCFIHISTAFVNRESKGTIPSAPPLFHPISLNVDAEMKLASHSNHLDFHDIQRARKMKELGVQRARNYGWRNVYEHTKAMGEMQMVLANNEEIPIVIIRPSIIESTYRDPFPGWIQGTRVLDPMILLYGKGYLPVASIDPETVLDVVPLDMIVNAIIAAMAKHGTARKQEQNLSVYHVVSSGKNPLLTGKLFDFIFEHFKSSPLISLKGEKIEIKRVKFLSHNEDPSPYIVEAYLKLNEVTNATSSDDKTLSQNLQPRCEKVLEHIARLAKVYGPYAINKGSNWFDKDDTEELMAAMSEEEKQTFGFDVEKIDWKDFFLNSHIPGVRKYVIKGRRTMTN